MFYSSSMAAKTPSACIVDTTPPTFGGITSAIANANGSITVSWSLATDATAPISYRIYIALGSVNAASLFVNSNIVTIAPAGNINKKVFTLANQTTYLIAGQVYTFGVRAMDGVGNVDSNTTIILVTGIGFADLPGSFHNTEVLLGQTAATFIAGVEAVAGGPELEAEPEADIDLDALPESELELEADEE